MTPLTLEELEQLCRYWERVDSHLTHDVVVETAEGHVNPAAHARRFATVVRSLAQERERLRLGIQAFRDSANLCAAICPACEENAALAIELLHETP